MYKSLTKLEQYAAAVTLIVRHNNVWALMRRTHNAIAEACVILVVIFKNIFHGIASHLPKILIARDLICHLQFHS